MSRGTLPPMFPRPPVDPPNFGDLSSIKEWYPSIHVKPSQVVDIPVPVVQPAIVNDFESFFDVPKKEQYPSSKDHMDWKVPGQKFKGQTYRDLMATREGRQYLAWWYGLDHKDNEFVVKHRGIIDECFERFDTALVAEEQRRGCKRTVALPELKRKQPDFSEEDLRQEEELYGRASQAQ